MNDLLVFARNLLIVAPLLIVLFILGIKFLRFNRFYNGEYALFNAKLAANNNRHPSVKQRRENIIVGAAGAIIIAGLIEVIDNRKILFYLAGIILGGLVLWDLASLPSQLRRYKEWYSKLNTQDKATYNKYKNYRRQFVLLITFFVFYLFLSLRFLP